MICTCAFKRSVVYLKSIFELLQIKCKKLIFYTNVLLIKYSMIRSQSPIDWYIVITTITLLLEELVIYVNNKNECVAGERWPVIISYMPRTKQRFDAFIGRYCLENWSFLLQLTSVACDLLVLVAVYYNVPQLTQPWQLVVGIRLCLEILFINIDYFNCGIKPTIQQVLCTAHMAYNWNYIGQWQR